MMTGFKKWTLFVLTLTAAGVHSNDNFEQDDGFLIESVPYESTPHESVSDDESDLYQGSSEYDSIEGRDGTLVPIAFATDTWGLAIGVAGVASGVLQPQSNLFATGMISTNGNVLLYSGIENLLIPNSKYFLFGADVQYASFSDAIYYVPGNPDYAGQTPGSNGSSANNRIHSGSQDRELGARLTYILPIADGRQGAFAVMGRDGPGSEDTCRLWNPFYSGITTIGIRPFYSYEKVDDYTGQPTDEVIGIRFALDYDNRDSTQLPSDGSRTTYTVTHDWGGSDRPEWTTWELEFSKFVDLGSNGWADQQVFAFNAWLADTPSWNDYSYVNGEVQYHRPPWFEGVSLGGWNRLRGYDEERFYSRSAVSYSFEYRVLPSWQPLGDLPVVGSRYDIPWWQWTLFMDVGRVADEPNLLTLHKSMHFSYGGGVRLSLEGVTLRAEAVGSDEDRLVRIFLNQPF